MNIFHKIAIYSFFLNNFLLSSEKMSGILSQIKVENNLINYYNAPLFGAKKMYKPGGITIVFPEQLFPQVPYVFVSLLYKGLTPPTQPYHALIYNLSNNTVSIKVFDSQNNEITERNLIAINLFAFSQDPNGEAMFIQEKEEDDIFYLS